MSICKPVEFSKALNQKLAQHKLNNGEFAKLLEVDVKTVNNVATKHKYCFSRNNILKAREVFNLSVNETNLLLELAGREKLTLEEVNYFENTHYVWHAHREDYKVYQKEMPSHPILEEMFKHINTRKNPLLILSTKASFQNVQARVLKGFLATQFPKGNFLEIVPPYLEDEPTYFSSLAEQLGLEHFNQITNNNDFKKLFINSIKEKTEPTFLLVRHTGNVHNAELLARVLRSVVDTLDSKSVFHPIWVAGHKLEIIATKSTDSIFSIGRMIYYKMEVTDIQLLAYEWQINGVDYSIANEIFKLTGGHYTSVEFCLDFFEEKNRLAKSTELKNHLLNFPLFDNFITYKEMLNFFINQETINIPTAHLVNFPIVKKLYFDGLLKKINEGQFAWVNPTIQEIGLEIINMTPQP